MNAPIRGNVIWKFDDNFNSDLVTTYPKFKDISDEEGLRRICMSSFDPEFSKKVKRGDIIVGGRNFGFGHPHVQAHYALKAVGISCIIAESIARLWQRTAISVGLPAFACEHVHEHVNVGDILEADLGLGIVTDVTTGRVLRCTPLPSMILEVLQSGGTIPYLRKSLETRHESGDHVPS
jgi:3-isopropylmalate/(R)-2-methylmalate dehydratase small subunit